jgi:hypothetical protein
VTVRVSFILQRSTKGYDFTVGGTTISWISKLQKVVSLSTTEAEYVVATEASKEMIWLQRFMEELGKKQENSRLYYDSESAIHIEKKSTFHSKTKHINIRYHFILSILEYGHLKLEKIHTSCWLWSLIIFLIQRSLFSAMFIPHEDFTPRKNVHSSTRGSAGGVTPSALAGGESPEGKIAL